MLDWKRRNHISPLLDWKGRDYISPFFSYILIMRDFFPLFCVRFKKGRKTSVIFSPKGFFKEKRGKTARERVFENEISPFFVKIEEKGE